MQVRALGQEDSLEEGITTHSSFLAWRTPWTEEPGRLLSIGSQRVRHNRRDLACTQKARPGKEEQHSPPKAKDEMCSIPGTDIDL